MVAFLKGQIEFLGKQVDALPRHAGFPDLKQQLDEAVSLSLVYFNLISEEAARICPRDAWTEEAGRRAAGIFRPWLEMASKTLALMREAKARGVALPSDADRFMQAYLSAKMARDFDATLEAFRRLDRGESEGRPVEELLKELEQ